MYSKPNYSTTMPISKPLTVKPLETLTLKVKPLPSMQTLLTTMSPSMSSPLTSMPTAMKQQSFDVNHVLATLKPRKLVKGVGCLRQQDDLPWKLDSH